MIFAHISDLHLGINLFRENIIDDQRFVINEIIKIIKNKRPNAVLISGDIYDKPMPPEDAVGLFDMFLKSMYSIKIPVLIISGNHDSFVRLGFASEILEVGNVYIAAQYNGSIKKVTLKDEYGNINFFMLPFIKPSALEGKGIKDSNMQYEKTIKQALSTQETNKNERNVIMAHLIVDGATVNESSKKIANLPGTVTPEIFDDFDYGALGHIHKAQWVKRETLRYSGSVFKYSFSESNNVKALTFVEMKEKGNINITEEKIPYKRDVKIITGYFDDLIKGTGKDLLKINLEDKKWIKMSFNRLKESYPNLLVLKFLHKPSGKENKCRDSYTSEESVLAVIEDFYKRRTGEQLKKEQEQLIKEIINEVF